MKNPQKDNQSRLPLTKEEWELQKIQAEEYYAGLIGDRLHDIPKKRFVVNDPNTILPTNNEDE